jgi:HAMP domain-containing protein
MDESDTETADVAGEYNQLVDQLSRMKEEICRVCDEMGLDGRFGGQAEVPEAEGAWKEMVDAVNVSSRNLTIQIRTVAMVSKAKLDGENDTIITAPATGEMHELFQTINAMRC